ncbi:hypothetical protein ACMYZ5_04505 [Bacteroides sp. KG68]
MTKITLSPILTVMLTAVSHGQNISTEREQIQGEKEYDKNI